MHAMGQTDSINSIFLNLYNQYSYNNFFFYKPVFLVCYTTDNKPYKGTGKAVVYGVYPHFACPLMYPYTLFIIPRMQLCTEVSCLIILKVLNALGTFRFSGLFDLN